MNDTAVLQSDSTLIECLSLIIYLLKCTAQIGMLNLSIVSVSRQKSSCVSFLLFTCFASSSLSRWCYALSLSLNYLLSGMVVVGFLRDFESYSSLTSLIRSLKSRRFSLPQFSDLPPPPPLSLSLHEGFSW